ncbi:hydrolase, partial [Streptomyces justiciae]|nr:hydrolase [Streptomyces justiciae]
MPQLPRSRHRLATALAVLGLLVTGAAVETSTAPPAAAVTPHRILFDNAHAETAGNADWIISTSQPEPLGEDSSPSSETDWTGAISSWGVALQKTGDYSLKTLPSGSSLTYGGSGAQDLA